MKRLILPLMMCCVMIGCLPTGKEATAAENPTAWGNSATAEDVKVTDKSEKKLPGGLRKGLTLRQRRAMGLTFRNIKTVLEKKQAAGEIEGKDASTLAVEVFDELVDANPQAFGDPGIDWDRILEFLEKLIPLILKIIALFS